MSRMIVVEFPCVHVYMHVYHIYSIRACDSMAVLNKKTQA